MRRRTALIAGVGLGAAAVGAGLAAWRLRLDHADEDVAEFWTLRFEQPAGGELALQSLKGKPLLVNFWATWCPPCITELPLIDDFHAKQAGRWQVVALAIDSPTPVRTFLERRPLGMPVGLAGLNGVELVQRLGNRGGALPFTVVFDSQGRLRERKLGILKPEDLSAWAGSIG